MDVTPCSTPSPAAPRPWSNGRVAGSPGSAPAGSSPPGHPSCSSPSPRGGCCVHHIRAPSRSCRTRPGPRRVATDDRRRRLGCRRSSTAGEVVVHVAGAVVGARRVPPAGVGPGGRRDRRRRWVARRCDDRRRQPRRPGARRQPDLRPGARRAAAGGRRGRRRPASTDAGARRRQHGHGRAARRPAGHRAGTAAAIVAYRDAHGSFSTVDDLGEVRGIGPAKLDALRGLVTRDT